MYYCFHVVHSALWSRMCSKLAPLKSTSGHLKIGQRNRWVVAAASRKRTKKKTRCGQPQSSRPKYVVRNNQNCVVKPCGRKPLRAGKNEPASRAFFFRRCRIVTLAWQIVKYKIHFVCYSSVGHDELNAIYRKRYARP